MFLRRDYPVYLWDGPRVGRANWACVPQVITACLIQPRPFSSNFGGLRLEPRVDHLHWHQVVAATVTVLRDKAQTLLRRETATATATATEAEIGTGAGNGSETARRAPTAPPQTGDWSHGNNARAPRLLTGFSCKEAGANLREPGVRHRVQARAGDEQRREAEQVPTFLLHR